LTMNPDGTIKVSPETPAGVYEFPYTICEVLNPENCSSTTVTIIVEQAIIEAIVDHPEPINGSEGGSTPSVLDNDILNKEIVKPEEVTLTWIDEAPDGLTLNPDGSVTVAPGTPEGSHTIRYRICEVLNPANCSQTTVTVVVEPTLIEADNDPLRIEWNREIGSTPSVLENDSFNNGPVDLDKVRLTPGIPSDPGLTMNPDGTITIAPSTRPGTYEYPYTICEVLNPNNCASAVAIVVVEINKLFVPNVFTPNGDGTNDTFELIGIENYDRVEVVIINRWGNEVYRNGNYRNEWNGANLNEGTYYYIITTRKGGNAETLKGWVLIKKR